MNEEPIIPSSPGITLGDIYYVLFRHKWKIIVLSLLGLGIALALPYFISRPYQSEAKILIPYVVETKSPGQGDSREKYTDEGGASIINSEIAILTSLDLAQEVADIVGPEKILGKGSGPKDSLAAANLIHRSLIVPSPNKSSVIQIFFTHTDPAVVQPVLNELIESYFKKHAEVHRRAGVFDDSLTQETDQLRSRLAQTENALRMAKTNAGIISLEETKRSYSAEIARIRSEIFAVEAELAQREAIVQEIAKMANTQVSTTNISPGTVAVVPPDKIAEYRRLTGLLDTLMKREQDLSLQFTSDNPQLKGIQDQISASGKIKDQLEKEHPGLLSVAVESKSGNSKADPRIDLQKEMAVVVSLNSKIETLTNQLTQIRGEVAALDMIESSITDLQRKKELEESNYKKYLGKLEDSRIDEALGAGRISNISSIQKPSPPFRDNAKLIKLMAGTCIGAFALAFVWAFLTEFYLDRSIRRPTHITSQMDIPLFLSIPRLNLNGKHRGLKGGREVPMLNAAQPKTEEENTAVSKSNATQEKTKDTSTHADVAPWEGKHPLRPFYETLRDRLIAFFEVNNMTHKPKLVALTSCGEGAGVTTTAMGLAASLSETGEGNVLLVDMNLQEGEAHHFHKGRLECGLDDALASDKRQEALVQDNLYVVAEGSNGNNLSHHLPKRFKHLVPRLRASDYDYIIFDMPPTNQISNTLRLAQFMDMVFLVVESEKTGRDVAKHAAKLLSDSKANVGIVLNKTKSYVPKRLQEEF